MKIFLDSININAIQIANQTGLIDGVTTNPSLFLGKQSSSRKEIIRDICQIIAGPVSVQLESFEEKEMLKEAYELRDIADNVVIKAPLTVSGLKVCRVLTQENIDVNVTLCFSMNQALLAAKSGALYVSVFMGRLDDISGDGFSASVIEEVRHLYDQHEKLSSQILAASIRSPYHVRLAAQAGADVVTLNPKIFENLYQHPLTDSALDDRFLKGLF